MSGRGQEDRPDDVAATDAAEEKRRQARRRFLTGGAVGGVTILTLGPRRSFAISELTCLSIGGNVPTGQQGKGLTNVTCNQIP